MEYEPDGEIIGFREKAASYPSAVGDKVRIDIPDKADPDHDSYHGRTGDVIELLDDDAGEETGDDRDAALYTSSEFQNL